MVGRNILGLHLVGECLLERQVHSLFSVYVYSVVYLTISEICILRCMSGGYLLCMARCLSLLCCGMDLVLCR
jgi:hypothetical protein